MLSRACAVWLLGLAILFVTPASAQDAPVIDPVLRRVLEPDVRRSVQELAVRADTLQPLGGLLALEADATGTVRVGVFLEAASPEAVAALIAAGSEVRAITPSISHAWIPLDALDLLRTLPVARVQAVRTLRVDHDSSMISIGADQVRQRTAAGWTGATGAGAIVGVIDTGIDIRHPDFIDENGQTRILGLWDQTLFGTPPAGFSYGFTCSRQQIQTAIDSGSSFQCSSTDSNGHGTHVAGTAAGDGSAGPVPFRYAGVAPEASLLIVKAGNGGFSEARIVDGLLWLRDQARALGRPIAINLSFGHHYGPHDGSTLFERVIDELAAPGFLIAISAGNEGANATSTPQAPRRLIHARVQPVPGQTRTLSFVVPPYTVGQSSCERFVWLSIWYHLSDRLAITVRRPNGTEVSAQTQRIVTSVNADGRVVINNAFGAQVPTNAEAFIEIDGCSGAGPPAVGTWEIRLHSEGSLATGTPADLYLHTSFLGTDAYAYGTQGFDNAYVVATPGTVRRGITVGAYATRTCWDSGEGRQCYTDADEVGNLARFSSGGPTRDGRAKPEVTAPGVGIISARSSAARPPGGRIMPGGTHWVLEGTSMATPHVTGALALLLERRPGLSPEEAQEIIALGSRTDRFTDRAFGVTPGAPGTQWWGAGKLHVPSLLDVLLGGGAVVAVDATPARDTLPLGGVAQLAARAVDAGGRVVYAAVEWRTLDPAVATVDRQGRVRGVTLGAARVVAEAGPAADTVHVTVVEPATLIVARGAASPAAPLAARADSVVPLLPLRLRADGPEGVAIEQAAFALSGPSVPVRVLLYNDADADGVIGEGDHVIDHGPRLDVSASPTVLMRMDTLVVGRNATRNVILALLMERTPPHGGRFTARLVPDQLGTVTVNSRVRNRFNASDATALGAAQTTVLQPVEKFALSENPIRAESVIFSFSEPPTTAAVYTVTGTRVVDLRPRINTLSHIWNLTNDDGERIVPGVYLLVVEVGGEQIRQRLFVLSPRAGGGQ